MHVLFTGQLLATVPKVLAGLSPRQPRRAALWLGGEHLGGFRRRVPAQSEGMRLVRGRFCSELRTSSGGMTSYACLLEVSPTVFNGTYPQESVHRKDCSLSE